MVLPKTVGDIHEAATAIDTTSVAYSCDWAAAHMANIAAACR